MKSRINIITLGVDYLERSLRFYRDGLGFPTDGIIGQEFDHGAVALFELHGGLMLSLFERDNLALDATIRRAPNSPTEFSIGQLLGSKDEVDAVMIQAEKAGAQIVKPAQDAFWGGYSGYFQDPDGHLWEILWNPAIPVD
jgi:catechol 2,3-dioxygenase-like lactoylglutathione lyase family enzyme